MHRRSNARSARAVAVVAGAIALATAAVAACGGRATVAVDDPDRIDKIDEVTPAAQPRPTPPAPASTPPAGSLLASLTLHSGAPSHPLQRGAFSSEDFGHRFVGVSHSGVLYTRAEPWQWPRQAQLDTAGLQQIGRLVRAASTAAAANEAYSVARQSVGNAAVLQLGDRRISVSGDPGCGDPASWDGIVPDALTAVARHLVAIETSASASSEPVEPARVKLRGFDLHFVVDEPVLSWPLSAIDLAQTVVQTPLVIDEPQLVDALTRLMRARSADRFAAPVFEQDGLIVAIEVWPVLDP